MIWYLGHVEHELYPPRRLAAWILSELPWKPTACCYCHIVYSTWGSLRSPKNLFSVAQGQKIGTDDVLIWLFLVICVCLNIVAIGSHNPRFDSALADSSIAMVKYTGVIRQMNALVILGQGEKIILQSKLLLAASWLYIGVVTLSKISVLVLYLQIFDSRSICMQLCTGIFNHLGDASRPQKQRVWG